MQKPIACLLKGFLNLFDDEKSSRFKISSTDAETGVFDVFVDVSDWIKARNILCTKSKDIF